MKKNKEYTYKPQRHAFKVTGYFSLWIWLFILALIFTQALRNPVSFIFIITVLAVPVLELLYVLIARFSIKAEFECSAERTEKRAPVTLALKVENISVLPLPFTEAELVLPAPGGVRTVCSGAAIPMMPKGGYEYESVVTFPYKGTYDCGINYVYVSSLLRFFRIRIRKKTVKTVLVVPSVMDADLTDGGSSGYGQSVSDLRSDEKDAAELKGIKEYVPGDLIKRIHWKLSGKSQQLMVKHYGAENSSQACVISDPYCAYEGEDDLKEYCDDAVSEICCSVVYALLEDNKNVTLLFPSKDGIKKKEFTDRKEFDGFIDQYTAEQTAAYNTKELAASSEGESNIIYVAAGLDGEKKSAICGSFAADTHVRVFIHTPYHKISDPERVREREAEYACELNGFGADTVFIDKEELL